MPQGFLELPEGALWPPPAIPIPGPLAVGTVAAFAGKGLFMGYSIEGGGVAGRVLLFDGADSSGQPLGPVDIPINSSAFPWFGSHGIYLSRGLAVQVTAAVASLTLFVAPLWRPGDAPLYR